MNFAAKNRLVAPVLFCALALPCAAKTTHPAAKKLSPFDQAVASRNALENAPNGTATRAQYNAVMDQFRAIYHANPGDIHAPDAVFAVAELLSEAGEQLNDTKLSQNAVGQYEFLRKNYPASHYRADCLLAEAAIEANDLHDTAAAKADYQLLLKTYPHSDKAPQAQAALVALKHGKAIPTQNSVTAQQTVPITDTTKPVRTAATPLPPSETTPSAPVTQVLPAFSSPPANRPGPPTVITGIRHWSTKSYTRVAIDLGDEVKYEAARVPNPDRIYFDLHSTRLAGDLVNKTFDVTDDGFLKHIRAAQFSDNVTRIVLDVNDVSDYSAFLLPNPYRLIIDIHGDATRMANGAARNTAGDKSNTSTLPPMTTTPAATQSNVAAAAALQTNPQAAKATTGIAHPDGDVALDAAAAANAPLITPPARKPSVATLNVPNTTARRTNNSADVATLSAQPGKVKATAAPTTGPIAQTTPQSDLVRAMSGETHSDTVAPSPAPEITSTKRGRKGKAAATEPAAPAHEAELTADGQRSLMRALGLKIGRVVIDAGHGGHDSGTLGAGGIEEKDVVLDVALRLGKMLKEKLGVDVIYTRSDDTFIPLETRTAIANKAQADLFISIHANSSSDSTARGVETYYLNFTSDPNALEVAARENAVSESSVYQLSDLVKKITLKDKIDESREFALDVETSLYNGLEKGNTGLKNRGIKKAPFVVLIGANMPSILAEISFVTNPKDAEQLRQPEYRQRVAESLYKGVAKYASGLSGVKAAADTTQPAAASKHGQ